MSRKFIAGVLAASLVVTGFSAAPSRAAEARDVAKVIGGAALVYMIGKAVSEARAEDRERDKKKEAQKKAQQEAQWRAENSAPYLPRPYVFDNRAGQVAKSSQAQPRGVLPGTCLREVRGERGAIMQRSCLRSAAVRTDALPDRCSKKIRIGKDKERVFSAQCLEKAGWRIVGRGTGQGRDRHDGWQRDWHHDGRRD
ncbi:hypothetical protein [Alloyangia pacifica]|uniref:Uncharacterized protein n=1 Tax=Alloyangia pacifica TaxID=311180 RepID=A0A1I6RIJ1_9RHOB|nr:hypothetical protein [Alloyangia pacifica]SDG51340.1 hypothetical protein SAMN04488245_103110 [Alloyangia pacifica]SFS64456.1 hypothetical protein SAMN04488050_103110 [Alloyangia pacifica]